MLITAYIVVAVELSILAAVLISVSNVLRIEVPYNWNTNGEPFNAGEPIAVTRARLKALEEKR